ncbi:MAG: hypothetical protein AAF533_00285 [Acidobacteriota bacterium]
MHRERFIALVLGLSVIALPVRATTTGLLGDDELLPSTPIGPAPSPDGILEDLEDILGDVEEVKEVTEDVPGKFTQIINQTDQIPGKFTEVQAEITETSREIGRVPDDVAEAVANTVTDAVDGAIGAIESEVDGAIGAIEGVASGLDPLIEALENVSTGDLFDLPADFLNNPLLQEVAGVLVQGSQDLIDLYFAAGGDYELIGDILSGCPPTLATDALEDLVEAMDGFLVNEVGIPQDVLDDLAILPPTDYASSSMSFYVQLRFKWYIDLLNDGMSEVDYPHPAVTVAKEIVTITAVVLDRLVLCIDAAADEADGAAQDAYRTAVLDALGEIQAELDDDTQYTDDVELAALQAFLIAELNALDAQIADHDAHVTALLEDLELDIDEDLAAQSLESLRLAIQTNLSLNAHFKLLVAVDPSSRGRGSLVSPAMHSFQLPESSGGHVELVDEIVDETIQSFLDLGLGINEAESFLALARDAIALGEYKDAYDHYSRAYHDAVNVQR